MTIGPDRIIEDLQRLLADLESLVARAKDATAEHVAEPLADATEGVWGMIGLAQRRLGELQAELEKRLGETVRAAESSVRENPWTTASIAATAAFLLGLALARGPLGRRRHRGRNGNHRADEAAVGTSDE